MRSCQRYSARGRILSVDTDPAFLRERGKSRRSLDRVSLDNIALRILDGAADRRNLVGGDRVRRIRRRSGARVV